MPTLCYRVTIKYKTVLQLPSDLAAKKLKKLTRATILKQLRAKLYDSSFINTVELQIQRLMWVGGPEEYHMVEMELERYLH